MEAETFYGSLHEDRVPNRLYGLQILHSIGNEQLELVHSMDQYMAKEVMPILKDVDKLWQPSDFLPESSSDTFLDEVSISWPLYFLPPAGEYASLSIAT